MSDAMKTKTFRFPVHSLVVRNQPFLKQVYHALKNNDEASLRRIIRRANSDEIKAICEISQNLLRGNFPKKDKKFLWSLRPYKNILRKISCRNVSINKKKKILQEGGALPLLPILAPIISSLIGSAITTAIN